MGDIRRISPSEASVEQSNGRTYVDVRTVEEFEAGHPAGAMNVPLQHRAGQNHDFIRAMKAMFSSDAKIIVGCKAGVRSRRAAEALVAAGFTDVSDQSAGWDGTRSPFGQLIEKGWSQLGLPREEGAPAGRSWVDVQAKAFPNIG